MTNTNEIPKTRAEYQSMLATETPNSWIPRPEIRKWVYRVLAAAGPIVVFYGWMTSEEIALWLGLGGTVLGTTTGALASTNVPRS